jgi:hypothetical protein
MVTCEALAASAGTYTNTKASGAGEKGVGRAIRREIEFNCDIVIDDCLVV